MTSSSWAIVAAAAAIVIVLAGVWARKKLGARSLPEPLRIGKPLPDFVAQGEDGTARDSRELEGTPAVILFVRGNWCPFCSRQVANLTKHYKEINDRGARLILVTPKPLQTTRRVAEFFEFEFEFWLDPELKVAEQLGLLLDEGVPAEYREEWGQATLWPAALVTDRDRVIRYASVSKLIADRPDPAKFVQALAALA